MRGMNDVPLTQHKQPEQLAGHQDLALAVLPRHTHTKLKALPTTILANTQPRTQNQLLLNVKRQPNPPTPIHRLVTQRLIRIRHNEDPRPNNVAHH